MKNTSNPTRKKIRLENHDYRSPGYYHIVILTNNRESFLGYFDEGVMILSPFGEGFHEILENISDVIPNIEIIKFQIMPDHVHILVNLIEVKDTEKYVSIPEFVSRIKTYSVWKYKNGQSSENTPEIPTKAWHRSYYDHILRTNDEAELTFNYIEFNPDQFE